ncbi:MAG TPA: hypothetical protein VK213_11575 [Bacteroidales bacterium]|nr:hypothetical protein [Bacteroidales bacterium]
MDILFAIKILMLIALHWAPRILCILIIIFLSLFSFDVFGQDASFWKTLIAFLVHNIPSFVLIIILVLSWKWSWIGGLSYIALGFIYILWMAERSSSDFIAYSLFAIGILFLSDWFMRKQIRKAQQIYAESQ